MPAPPLCPTVFYFCRLGDMVMLTPLLEMLHRRYRLPCQVIGAGSWTDAIYQANPDVSRVWSFHRHLPFVLDRTWIAVRRALRASAPGPIYVCERHYRQLPRIRRMLALSGIDPRRCVFVTDEAQTEPLHLVDRLVRFGASTPPALASADYPLLTGVPMGPRLHVLDSERERREAWLADQGCAGRPYVLIQPGNHRTMGPRRRRWRRLNTDDKAWPVERWAALARLIHARMSAAVIVLRGSVEEVPMLREIQQATRLREVAVAGTNLRDFFALAAGAHSVISVDTGPAHAAAALNVPLIVLYGAESSQHWLPRSPFGSAVVGVGGAPAFTRADQVPVADVFDAWCSLFPAVEASRSGPHERKKPLEANARPAAPDRGSSTGT